MSRAPERQFASSLRRGADAEWQRIHPGIPLLCAVIIGLWGAYLLYNVATLEATAVSGLFTRFRWASLLGFCAAFAAFMWGLRRGSAFYPLILFLLLQEGAVALSALILTWISVSGGAAAIPTQSIVIGVPGAFAAIYALILLISGIFSLFAYGKASKQETYASLPIAEDEERARRRVKAYFKTTPFWPWLIGSGGLILALVALFGPPETITQFNYPNWLFILYPIFLLNLMRLISRHGERMRLIDAPVFFIACYLSNRLLTQIAISYLYPAYGKEEWSEVWPVILSDYFAILGIAVFAYSLTYRFYIFRSLRRANEREIEQRSKADYPPSAGARFGAPGARSFAVDRRAHDAKGRAGQNFIGSTFCGLAHWKRRCSALHAAALHSLRFHGRSNPFL